MKRRGLFTARFITILSTITLVCAVVVIGISYHALRRLTFAGERILYGKKLSEIAQEIRSELLKQPNTATISFETSDGLKLAGLLVKRSEAQANVVICHGYKSAKELLYAYIDLFPRWNMLLFDFRSHGQSEGEITSIGFHEYKDVIAAVRFLRDQTGASNVHKLPLIVIGVSMGGAAALKAAEREPGLCDAVIVDSTFAQLDNLVRKGFLKRSSLPYYPFFPIIRQMFHYCAQFNLREVNPIESVKSISQPVLFIHSCNDSYISPKNAINLYNNASNKYSKLWIGPQCRHGLLHSYQSALYKKKVIKFLTQALPSFVIS